MTRGGGGVVTLSGSATVFNLTLMLYGKLVKEKSHEIQ